MIVLQIPAVDAVRDHFPESKSLGTYLCNPTILYSEINLIQFMRTSSLGDSELRLFSSTAKSLQGSPM